MKNKEYYLRKLNSLDLSKSITKMQEHHNRAMEGKEKIAAEIEEIKRKYSEINYHDAEKDDIYNTSGYIPSLYSEVSEKINGLSKMGSVSPLMSKSYRQAAKEYIKAIKPELIKIEKEFNQDWRKEEEECSRIIKEAEKRIEEARKLNQELKSIISNRFFNPFEKAEQYKVSAFSKSSGSKYSFSLSSGPSSNIKDLEARINDIEK
jgi:hypothetical protein